MAYVLSAEPQTVGTYALSHNERQKQEKHVPYHAADRAVIGTPLQAFHKNSAHKTERQKNCRTGQCIDAHPSPLGSATPHTDPRQYKEEQRSHTSVPEKGKIQIALKECFERRNGSPDQ